MQQKPLKIGVTGGIGSGKSTVCKIFAQLGIPVYYADDAAKWLMQNDTALINSIQQLFGKDIYTKEQQLNRPKLAQIVFNDPTALKELEKLVHPAVHRHSKQWFEQQKNVPYTLKEAALIFESGSYKQLDAVITVFAPEALRIQRIQKRDKANVQQIKARMKQQLSDEEKIKLADYVIYNDEEKMLIPQVLHLHNTFLNKKNKHTLLSH